MATIHAYGPLGAGHVNPMLGIVAELVRRHHRVRFWAPAEFGDRIAETGARFEPVTSTWEQLGGQPPQMHGREFLRAMGLLLDETKAMVSTLGQAPKPDLVLHDGTLTWWGRILAHRWQLPAVETLPNLVSNRHWSMNAYTKINPVDPRFLWQMLRIGRYLRSQGIDRVGDFMQGTTAAARIVTVPRAFQYRGDTFDGWDFVGPCLTDRAFQGDWQPAGAHHEVGAEHPVLLVSLGSSYNARPDIYRMIIASAADRPWQVVMSIGDRVTAADLGPIPDNVEVQPRLPQLAVLRHARAFVTHAGMGGTMEGLRAGVPLIALPQMAEQRANADRIAELGLGVALDPDRLDAPTLWSAVEATADDDGIRDRLDWMRAEMDAAGGAPAAADVVDRVLAAQ
ncbi:macrolide family glycosyltransferase [Microlunatus soli]|uniref:macrolide family glycosyltransferase n=1 Tax=Microlunatus soli TaxID=630515 RepID=UPI000B86634B|nr:macrolide family glycosyltransferase [Microlunatus soli]